VQVRDLAVVEDADVRGHDAFGGSGGAGGVDYDERVVGGDAGEGERGAGGGGAG